MDDITLGGNVNDVSRDVELFKSEVEAIGHVLNVSTCEVISKSNILNLTAQVRLETSSR